MRRVNAVALSGFDAASINGVSIDANQLIAISFQAVFGDATAAGTLQIQMSNDICSDSYQPGNFVPTHWTNIPSASAAVVAGASVVVFLPQVSFRWMRAIYISSVAGSSTILVNFDALSM